MNEFKSAFAVQIAEMLEFREAIGYKADTHKAYLLKFDEFCCENYPAATELTERIALAWAEPEQGCGVGANQAIRAFGDYLAAMNEPAYILPEGYTSQKSSFNAYVFTDRELSALFSEIDCVQPSAANPHINIIAPVLFRLTYTCGLRPNESRELLREHVNLETGEIFITNTKKQRERMVVMSDDMLEYARNYETIRRSLADDNLFFFPSAQGTPYSANTIDKLIKSCWTRANPDITKKELPSVRVYDLRHRFASACLNRWLDEKRDLMVMLPYLRAYMGHLRMDDTLYYVRLLPEKLVKSGSINWDALDNMLPEVIHNA
jgi:integrase